MAKGDTQRAKEKLRANMNRKAMGKRIDLNEKRQAASTAKPNYGKRLADNIASIAASPMAANAAKGTIRQRITNTSGMNEYGKKMAQDADRRFNKRQDTRQRLIDAIRQQKKGK